MSYHPRSTSGMMRPSSGLGGASTNSQSSVLQARINEKKLELESLKQLRDLSAGLAGQMQQLEDKLATLNGGTEAVAAVMANWNTVLRAIQMASGGLEPIRSFSMYANLVKPPYLRRRASMIKARTSNNCLRPWSGYRFSKRKRQRRIKSGFKLENDQSPRTSDTIFMPARQILDVICHTAQTMAQKQLCSDAASRTPVDSS
jgi:DASH complex subunit DAD2